MKARRTGFTLLELLMVLGVLGVLMGMMIPSVGIVREKAQRMVTGNKLRQVGLSVATYHSMTGRSLTGDSLAEWAVRLAGQTGLAQSEVFLFNDDPLFQTFTGTVPPVLLERSGSGDWEPVTGFTEFPIGLAVASGVDPYAPPATTPIAWTRGLTSSGRWLGDGSPRAGVYGDEGGFIVFLDGHVRFYRDLSEEGGQLVAHDSSGRTGDIREALGPGVRAYDFLGRVF
jgi:prepilin-type N-terminal cleavage/methylation domain-containing protein